MFRAIRGIAAAQGCAGRCKHRPLHRYVVSWGCLFPFGRNMDSGSQGRDLSLPRVFAAAQGSGGMRASRPTVVLYVPHQPGNPRVSGARNLCRGGFHIRPGCLRRREPGRYGIGPYRGNHNRRSPANNKPSGPYRLEGLRFMKRYKTRRAAAPKSGFCAYRHHSGREASSAAAKGPGRTRRPRCSPR